MPLVKDLTNKKFSSILNAYFWSEIKYNKNKISLLHFKLLLCGSYERSFDPIIFSIDSIDLSENLHYLPFTITMTQLVILSANIWLVLISQRELIW